MATRPLSLADLKAAASLFDGRSCGPEGESRDIITNDRGDKKGTRLDVNGTFQDRGLCCIVQKCVFGRVDEACKDQDRPCPSRWGRFDPRTCQAEQPQMEGDREVNDDAHRQGFFRSQQECCEHYVRLGGDCPARRSPDVPEDPMEQVCCSAKGANASGSSARDEIDDFLIA